MTVRHLVGGALLTLAATLFAGGQAFAQNFSYTTSISTLTFNGSHGGQVTATNSSASVTLPNGGSNSITLTNLQNTSTNGAGNPDAFSTPFTVQINIKDLANSQTVSHTWVSNNLAATNLSQTGGSFTATRNQTPLTYTFANGDIVTLSIFSFLAPGAAPGFGTATIGGFGADAAFAAAPSVAPEPGSMALVATGLMSTLGMVAVRRRKAA